MELMELDELELVAVLFCLVHFYFYSPFLLFSTVLL
jgi:hypothetical protein